MATYTRQGFYMALFGLIAYLSVKLILHYGTELVDRPKLVVRAQFVPVAVGNGATTGHRVGGGDLDMVPVMNNSSSVGGIASVGESVNANTLPNSGSSGTGISATPAEKSGHGKMA
jgi:hypothetical protein